MGVSIPSFYLISYLNFRISTYKDEFRLPNYNKHGGIDLKDDNAVSKFRSTGWEIIKIIGKKIISGDFNLTTIPFPIRVMIPKTILQNVALSIFQFPIYFNIAGLQKDKLERMKFIIVASLSCFHQSSNFWKPVLEMFNLDESDIGGDI